MKTIIIFLILISFTLCDSGNTIIILFILKLILLLLIEKFLGEKQETANTIPS